MGEPATLNRLISPEEYLRMELQSQTKHEYVAGKIFAMTGTPKRHNRNAANVFAKLYTAAVAGQCHVYFADVKLRARDDVFYCPHVMVACSHDDGDPYIEDAPCLLVDVTSPSTESVDRREKLAAYQRIPSLMSYLIVAHGERQVEHYWRDDAHGRQFREVTAGTIHLPCPDTVLALHEIFARLE